MLTSPREFTLTSVRVCVCVCVCVCVFRGMQERKRFYGVCVFITLFVCTEVEVCVCLRIPRTLRLSL